MVVEKLSWVCRCCQVALGERAGRGRPSTYCSTDCRRDAEYTRRRLRRELTALLAEDRRCAVEIHVYGSWRAFHRAEQVRERLKEVAADLGVAVPEVDRDALRRDVEVEKVKQAQAQAEGEARWQAALQAMPPDVRDRVLGRRKRKRRPTSN